mmetsp:Transcript_8851/g.32676  ORF Transcript_8851/g.32676 Transcript_8851/m.32676 type:complete len:131 (-) Transcript_8851:52-444(-)
MTQLPFTFTALATLGISFVNFVSAANSGHKRALGKVVAPSTRGDLRYEIAYRIQMNTLETSMVVLPSMWAFAYLSQNDVVAASLGALYLLGRILYAWGYPDRRMVGFLLGFWASILLIVGGLYYGSATWM